MADQKVTGEWVTVEADVEPEPLEFDVYPIQAGDVSIEDLSDQDDAD